MVLFGELQVTRSNGCTPAGPPCYISDHVFCYASGNSINFADTDALSTSRSASATQALGGSNLEATQPPVEIAPIIADGHITAFATHIKDSVLAYADSKSTTIKLVKVPGNQSLGTALQAPPDLSIVSLAFSRNGRYLASLGDLPSHQICIWNWRTGALLCKASNTASASQISFDPLESSWICTTGPDAGVRFWNLEVGYKQCNLVSNAASKTTRPIAQADASGGEIEIAVDSHPDFIPARHCWNAQHEVYCTAGEGCGIYVFSPNGGPERLIYSQPKSDRPVKALLVDNGVIANSAANESDDGNTGFTHIAVTKQNIVVAGKDGFVRWLSLTKPCKVIKKTKITNRGGINSMSFSPDYTGLSIGCENGSLFNLGVESNAQLQVTDAHHGPISALHFCCTLPYAVTGGEDGCLRIWDTENRWLLPRRIELGPPITTISCSSLVNMVAVGNQQGVVRIYHVLANTETRLLMCKRMHSAVVAKVEFDPTGRFLVSAGSDGKIFLVDVFEGFQPVGYVTVAGTVTDAIFNAVDDGGLFLYVVTNGTGSTIYKYKIPPKNSIVLENTTIAPYAISKNCFETTLYRTDDEIISIAILPSHMSGGNHESIYSISQDRKLKLYHLQGISASADKREAIYAGPPAAEYAGDEKSGGGLMFSTNNEVIISWNPDGKITLREAIDPERSATRVYVHNPSMGGVRVVSQNKDTRLIATGGGDGLLRYMEWKYTLTGRKAAAQLSKEVGAILEGHQDLIKDIVGRMESATVVEDMTGSADASPITDTAATEVSAITEQKKEEHSPSHIETRLQQIREKLGKIIQKNEQLPALERINRDEFVIDYEEKSRLLAEADMQVHAVRMEIQEENLKKRVIMNRIKKECWDSMEVIGQSVKSFQVDPLTNRQIEVSNYPLRKRDSTELGQIERVRLLRKCQLMSENETKIQAKKSSQSTAANTVDEETIDEGRLSVSQSQMLQKSTNDATTQPAASSVTTLSSNPSDHDLLYHPLELTTTERRRTQVVLLGQVVHQIMRDFNEKVKEFVKLKKSEIGKMEDKNDRIKAIMDELQISEALFHPELDDSEVPERVIEVQDDEVMAERFISPEEQKRLDERRRQEEDRLRASQEDDSHERALMVMMGGKLEDRTEAKEKEELVRPEWMNKATADLTDDERKLVKEFDKKLATQREEQEKYRKALETELRKLQGFIAELCTSFDEKLKEFFNVRLSTDRLLHQHELTIVKLCQSTHYSEEDELKEAGFLKSLEELKAEKSTCVAEIPEIKKDLERYREEYDMAVKRDKDLDRQFKKEFSSYDFFYDSLLKLFKRRETVADTEGKKQHQSDVSLDPFVDAAQIEGQTYPISDIPELNIEADLPEGLPLELWSKLVDLRNRKIAVEAEVRSTSQTFSEMQSLVASVLEGSERIKNETERVASEYVEFMEYKFLRAHNMESLFELKQGQVEVPQAPVVTDYTDAVLVHRSVVEKLNEAIASLGSAKVDALREMKEYRKGIHALEWENKMLDFQAEDLVIRTRDIQLLRVTKQMQEYIRGGDEQKQPAELAMLEKRAEHSIKAHAHKIEEKKRAAHKLKRKIREKEEENKLLDTELAELEISVSQRSKFHSVQGKHKTNSSPDCRLKAIADRSKLVDLAKSQQQDLIVLREEVERLRMRTFPSFSSTKQKGPGF